MSEKRDPYTFIFTEPQLQRAQELVHEWQVSFYFILYDLEEDHYYALCHLDTQQALLLYLL